MEYNEFSKLYKINANDQQEAAIKSTDGAVLLLAVPGSGKTTTLVARAGYMIKCQNISPDNILILTYTVNAAEDMKRRYIKKFGDENVPEFRTINGICSKLINRYCNKEGLKELTLVSDEKELFKILSQILQSGGEYPTDSEIREAKTLITYIKNMMLKKDEIETLDFSFTFPGGLLAVYNAYKKYMNDNHLMDYDDQMVYSYYYLKTTPWLLMETRNRFKHVFVDEAQDTSKIQHKIIELIAGKDGNIFMVGDEDQSIYGFRAAYPEALLNFESTYNNAKTMLLETNYRSDKVIIDTANSFIKKNFYRKQKKIVPFSKEEGHKSFFKVESDQEQYNAIAKLIQDSPDTQTAILYRNNESVIPILDMFERFGITYNVKGKNSNFFTNRAVVDIVDIIKFSHDKANQELFLKLYYKLGLYMNKKEIEEILSGRIAEKNIPKAISQKILPKEDRRKFIWNKFEKNIDMLSKLPMDMAVHFLTKDGGMYRKYMDSKHMNDNPVRILKTIAKGCENIDDLTDKLNHLYQIMLYGKNDPDSKIILSTIHASKGLEYDRVILIDVFDGCLPSVAVTNYANATSSEIKEYEEERRLFYVGVTRAKYDLVVLGISDKELSFYREISVKAKPKTKLAAKLGGEK